MATTPTKDDEVAFITGVKSNGTLTSKSYWGWNRDTPATYQSSWASASKWGGNTAGSAGGTVYYYFSPASKWSTLEQTQLGSGLALWAAVANINFVATTDSSKAQLTFARGNDGGAYTYTIFNSSSGACVNGGTILGTITSAPISLDTSVGGFGPINGSFSNYGGYPIETYLHEEGHALGLGHAGPYNGSVASTQQFSAYDSRQYTLMSYLNPGSGQYASQNPVTGTNWAGNYPTTWMPLDIQAIQRLYGVAVSTPLSGGQIFGFNSNIDPSIRNYFDFTKNTKPVITIWDKGTGNTLDLSGYTCATKINLNAGTYSSFAGMTNNLAIADGTALDTLVGSAGADTVTCNNNNDTVLSGAGNDVITAGAGNDTIDGGAGTDVVKYCGTRASYTLTTNSDGSTSITGSGIGTDKLSNIETLQFSDCSLDLTAALPPPPPPPPPPPTTTTSLPPQRDFDGNGKGDIILANANDAQVQIWLMDGSTTTASTTVSGMGSGWTTALTGDFDGDGKTDILWQNKSANKLQLWTMDGTTKVSSTALSLAPGSVWQAAAVADFDGDKHADILFQNGNQIGVWYMNGVTRLSSTSFSKAPPAGCKIIGTGDFNDDGKADILWQNSTSGQVSVWLVNGKTILSAGAVADNPGASLKAITTGDFNGDGKSDIVFQNTSSGQVSIWYMDGATHIGGGAISQNLGSSWKLSGGAADYNGDGTTDLLFRNSTTGAYQTFAMSGTNVLASNALAANPGTTWLAMAG